MLGAKWAGECHTLWTQGMVGAGFAGFCSCVADGGVTEIMGLSARKGEPVGTMYYSWAALDLVSH